MHILTHFTQMIGWASWVVDPSDHIYIYFYVMTTLYVWHKADENIDSSTVLVFVPLWHNRRSQTCSTILEK